jgi:Uncharacterized protein, homolog of Cu resistance protein CopC
LRKASILLIAAALVVMWTLPALGHAHLTRSLPAANDELSTVPSAICLFFSEPIERALSRIEVKDAQGNRYDDLERWRASEHAQGQAAEIAMPLKPLGPGEYTVSWRVLSVDTHSTQGEFRFSVLPEAAEAESEGMSQIRCDVPVS